MYYGCAFVLILSGSGLREVASSWGLFLLVFLQPLDVGSAQTHRAGSESDGTKQSASEPPVDGVGLHLQLCGCLADGDQVGSVFGPGLDDADRAALQGDCASFRRVDDDVRAHGSGRFLLCGLFGSCAGSV